MTFLMKKVVGLGLVLLGGLTAVYGGSMGQIWEISAGIFLAMIGAILLVLKIVGRNRAHISQTDH